MARQALQNNSRQPKVQIIFAFLIRESSVSTYENVYSQGSWLSAYLFSSPCSSWGAGVSPQALCLSAFHCTCAEGKQ